jgi:hypothetical protein
LASVTGQAGIQDSEHLLTRLARREEGTGRQTEPRAGAVRQRADDAVHKTAVAGHVLVTGG